MKKVKTLPALVLVDIQKGFNDPFWGARSNRRFEENVIALLRHWRAEGAHVSHVQHVSRDKLSPLRPHQAGVEFMEFAIPRPNERVFQKSVNSAFIGTSLEGSLRSAGIDRLLFAGLTTDHCVSTSVRMAANLGFQVEIASDAAATFDRQGQDGTYYSADLIHNVSLASLNGEFAAVRTTDELLSVYSSGVELT
jgi:nicotinamidase-related amidase